MNLDVEGQAAGVDEQQFQRYAAEAKATCPVSRALAGIPEIVLTAKLVQVSRSLAKAESGQ